MKDGESGCVENRILGYSLTYGMNLAPGHPWLLLCLLAGLLACESAPVPPPPAPASAPKTAETDVAPAPQVDAETPIVEEEMTSDDGEHAPPGYYENLPGETYNPGEYDARFRPRYHFTPRKGWMNDPNGLVYYDGEWHLFFQHYPDGNRWGPMHWGHAVSTDLMNWEELPIALSPDNNGYIFSGSVVVDERGLSPFAEDGGTPMIALFTYHDMDAERAGRTDYESQGLAYSHDRGRTWLKYDGNPVIPNNGSKDFRDPKVFYDEKNEGYTMVLAAQDHVDFYTTKNFIDWTYLSSFGADQPEKTGVWECPDLLPMRVAETGRDVYTLIVSTNSGHVNGGGSGTFYYTGDWDGKNFSLLDESEVYNKPGTKWLDYGRDNYATVSFADVPKRDGRTILLGWMSNWQYAQEVPTEGWRSAMTVPREVELHYDLDFGYRLHQRPVGEIERLRGRKINLGLDYLEDGITTIDLGKLKEPGVFELDLSVDLHGNSESLYFTLTDADNKNFYRFGIERGNADGRWIFTSRDQAGLREFNEDFTNDELTYLERFSQDAVVDFRVLFDKTSAEVFLDDGRSVATDIFFPTTNFSYLVVEVSGGQADLDGELGFTLDRGEIWSITPVFNQTD